MRTIQQLQRVAAIVLVAVGMLLLLDGALDAWLFHGDFAKTIVAIQQPATLLTKLDYLRRQSGYKVVVLGDSLIHGHALAEHGDPLWREHNLTALLEERLRAERPGRRVTVLNLGINGAVPADLEQMVRLVSACQVDLVIFDVHLRNFSADFAAADHQLSRPWLKDLSSDQTGHVYQSCPEAGWSAQGETALANALESHLALYRIRDLVQDRILASSLARTTQAWRQHWSCPEPAQPAHPPDPEGLVFDEKTALLFQVQKRLRTVHFGSDNPQRQALERMLASLRDHRQRTIVFYAQENPEQIISVIRKSRYHQLRRDLDHIVNQYRGEHLTYLQPSARLQPVHYLDFVHVNLEGYQIMVDHLWEAIRGLPG